MIMYKVDRNGTQEVEIKKITQTRVLFTNGYWKSKSRFWLEYFPTKEEAIKHYVEYLQFCIISMERHIDDLRKQLSNYE